MSNNIDGETCISAVNEDSPLADKVFQGDKVVCVDEIDVSQAGVEGKIGYVPSPTKDIFSIIQNLILPCH